jgi:hypothetical protein
MLDGSAAPERFGRTSSDGVRLEAMRLLNAKGKIQAIKFVRDKKGVGLAQAKAYVEALASGANPDDAARSVPATSGGCAPILAFILLAVAGLVWWWAR